MALIHQVGWGGNGTSQAISVPFQAAYILIKRSATGGGQPIYWNDQMPAGDAKVEGPSAPAAFTTTAITAVGPSSFTLGSNAAVNASGGVYRALIFGKDVGRRELITGTYEGDDASPTRNVTVGFADPTKTAHFVHIWTESSSWTVMRWQQLPTGAGSGTTMSPPGNQLYDRISGYGADYFQVSDGSLADVNAVGSTYYYTVLSLEGDDDLEGFTYTGDGGGDTTEFFRKISYAFIYNPKLVISLGSTLGRRPWIAKSIPSGMDAVAFNQTVGVFGNGCDQSLGFADPGALLIGNDNHVNASGETHYAIVFRATEFDDPPNAPVAKDSNVGFGKPGLRHHLRPFSELVRHADSLRSALMVVKPGEIVTGFTLDASNTYVAPYRYEIDSVVRDVVGVRTLVDPKLTRTESVAECQATPGSYYFDRGSNNPTRSWDDGIDWWDESLPVSWDDGIGFLYVHLSDNSDASLTTVFAQIGFYFGTRGERHPELGPNLLTNGGFESDLTGWTSLRMPDEGWTDAASSMFAADGSKSYQLTATDYGTAAFAGRYQDISSRIDGGFYRLAGYYLTLRPPRTGFYAAISAGSTGLSVWGDGRSLADTFRPLALLPTEKEWRRFVFDFYSPSTTIRAFVGAARGSTDGAGTVYFDGVTLQRIHRFNDYASRLHSSGLPRLSAGSREPFFGQSKIGGGSAGILNGDAQLDVVTGGLEWLNQEVEIRDGGEFFDGQEIPIDDAQPHFSGTIQDLNTDDEEIRLDLEDFRRTIHRAIPTRLYSANVQTGLDTKREGKPRPVHFGPVTNIEPTRVAVDDDGKPTYEIADTTDTEGIHSVQAVYLYTSDTAARNKETSERVTLVESSDYSKDLAAGSITLLRDLGPILIDDTNDQLDFNDGGNKVATVAQGLYKSMEELAAAIETAIGAVTTNETCSYDETTHLFTVGRTTGTMNLLINTGSNKDRGIWKTIGFDLSADKTGSSSYAADNAVYDEIPETAYIVRVDATGFKDDASGTYTGTAGAAIQLGPDIVRFLWVKYLLFDPAKIDEATFVAARTSAARILGLYIDTEERTGEIFETIALSTLSNITVIGDGTLKYDVITNDTPADVITLTDSDIVDWREGRTVKDAYGYIEVRFATEPATGASRVREASDSSFSLTVRSDPRRFDTYLTDSDDAQLLADQLLTLATSRPRVARVQVRGRLDTKRVGEKVLVTRTRASLSPTGANAGKVYRIREVSLNALEPGDSSAVLVEAIGVPT